MSARPIDLAGRGTAATARRVALGLAAVMLAAACQGAGSSEADTAPTGPPVSGGVGRIIQMTEPRSLDPAILQNSVASGGAIVGNALYGTLMIDDPQSGEITFTMAEDLASEDGGATFDLSLREGLMYSDGTALTAEDVQYNWERTKDPILGSSSLPQASLIASAEAVDDTTLRVTLIEPIPNFAQVIVGSSLNWIGKPEVLEAGDGEVDRSPIGAGPFTLADWSRQDVIRLERNDAYWDAPKPYLDELEVRTVTDGPQRYNTLLSGAADLVLEAEWVNLARGEEQAGHIPYVFVLNGGAAFTFNMTREPFDDLRAREAISLALDLDAVDEAIFEGTGQVPHTLFDQASPFFSDIALPASDAVRAQELFDELADEGSPLTFTFTAFASPQGRATGELVQAQLAQFDHVEVQVDIVEIAEIGAVNARGDFQMGIGGSSFTDPEPQLWLSFHAESAGNFTRIDDAELNEALDAARAAQSHEARQTAYETVQRRLVALMPMVFYSRSPQGVIATTDVGGVKQYGLGSVLPEDLWLQD